MACLVGLGGWESLVVDSVVGRQFAGFREYHRQKVGCLRDGVFECVHNYQK